MSDKNIERKIAVIFATDVVSYSKHMENNENGTLQSLRECSSILKKIIKTKKGRVFNTGGDSILAEFPSAVSAIEAGVKFQELMISRNKGEGGFVKLEYRVGINMGDVILEGTNLLGDGVNIAARLEALSQPNGITISKSIFDLVKSKTNFAYNDLGTQKVKENIFQAYDVLVEPSQKRSLRTGLIRPLYALVFAAALLLLLVGFVINRTFQDDVDKFKVSDKPSVLIKPFIHRSSNNANQHVSEGMTDTIISYLSQYPQLIVQSRSTSDFISKKELIDEEISEKYGVRFVLTGTNQIANQKIRTTVELSDLTKSKIIWSQKYDFDLDDIFSIQDNIAENVLSELQIKLTTGKKLNDTRKYFKSAQAWSISKNAHINYMRCDRDGVMKATELFEELFALEPENPVILVDYAWYLTCKYITGLMEKDQVQYIARDMNNLVDRALSSGPDYGFAYTTKAGLLAKQPQLFPEMTDASRIEKAVFNNRKGVELDPTGITTLGAAGNTFTQLQMPDDAQKTFQKALSLVPYPPANIKLNYSLSLTSFGQYEKGFELAKELSESEQYFGDAQIGALGIMTYIFMKQGKDNKAKDLVKTIYKLKDDASIKSMMRSMKTFISTDQAFLTDLSDKLILAGIKS